MWTDGHDQSVKQSSTDFRAAGKNALQIPLGAASQPSEAALLWMRLLRMVPWFRAELDCSLCSETIQLEQKMETRNMTTLQLRNSVSHSLSLITFHYSLLTVLLLALWPTPKAFGVTPAPDGGYPNRNTAEGDSALLNLTTGSANTANGFQALVSDTAGSQNAANGAFALAANTTGNNNTANGFGALYNNMSGSKNTANGVYALFSNTTGDTNTANGFEALLGNTTSYQNTATGAYALLDNSTGVGNTANGYGALYSNIDGVGNTAIGNQSLFNNTGSYNVALNGGFNLTNGIFNIDIANDGAVGESYTTRIGILQTRAFIAGIYGAHPISGVTVYVNSDGQLGTLASSARFKQNIQSMDKASEAILALKPVT